MSLGVNNVQNKVLVLGGNRIPVSGQGVFCTLATPPRVTLTEDNSGIAVISRSTVRTTLLTVNTSQYVPAAGALGAMYAMQEAAFNAGTFEGFPFQYTDLDAGTKVTAAKCVILKGADVVGQREDADVTWEIAALGSAVTYSPAVPVAVV